MPIFSASRSLSRSLTGWMSCGEAKGSVGASFESEKGSTSVVVGPESSVGRARSRVCKASGPDSVCVNCELLCAGSESLERLSGMDERRLGSVDARSTCSSCEPSSSFASACDCAGASVPSSASSTSVSTSTAAVATTASCWLNTKAGRTIPTCVFRCRRSSLVDACPASWG